MPRNPENKFVVSQILRALIRITSARSRRTNECQSNGVIIRLVRSVLAIRENCGAEFSGRIGQINPLVRRDFELFRLRGRPLDCADVPVISRPLVRSRKSKRRLQIGFLRVPIDHVGKLHALPRVPGRQADGLHELRSSCFSGNFHSHPCRPVFRHTNLRRASDICLRGGLLLLPVHIPRRPLLRIVIGNRKTNGG